MEKSKDQKLAGTFIVTGDWKYKIKQSKEMDLQLNDEDSKSESIQEIGLSKRAKVRVEACHYAY